MTFNCRKPYVGWPRFREGIESLISAIEESRLAIRPQRHGLRYLDLFGEHLGLPSPPDTSPLGIRLHLGAREIRREPLQARIELTDEGCQHVVQIAAPVRANLSNVQVTGTVTDLETYIEPAPADLGDLRSELDHLHDRSKRFFFEYILTEETISSLEPEY